MNKYRIAEENGEAEGLLPPAQPDGSLIGVNYTDAWIKVLNTQVEDGPKVSCKRKGLKIMLQVGEKSGEAIMNRLEHGPDPKDILREAVSAAASAADCSLSVEEGAIYLETND